MESKPFFASKKHVFSRVTSRQGQVRSGLGQADDVYIYAWYGV